MVKIMFEDTTPSLKTSTEAANTFTDITLTPAAAARIEEIKQKRAAKGQTCNYLRIRVDGGGCNGYSYKFLFEEATSTGDITLTHQQAHVLIDPMSYQYLLGAVIDYVESLEASQFIIRNPNATSSCGCGNSFGL